MNRREFIAASSTVAAALACRASPAATLADGPLLDVTWVLFDRRFEPSKAFGLAGSGMEQRTYGIDGDVTAFWSKHLDALWRGGAGAVAGMTTATSLACLEQLAAQHWFRVIARVEHRPCGEQTVSHRISAEPRWTQRLRGGLAASGWPQHFAAALLEPGCRGVRQERMEFSTRTSSHWLDAPPLVSWYIASRTTARTTVGSSTSRHEVEI